MEKTVGKVPGDRFPNTMNVSKNVSLNQVSGGNQFTILYEPTYAFQNNRYLLNTYDNYKEMLLMELAHLEKDFKFKHSCGEQDVLKYVQQALDQVTAQIINLNSFSDGSRPPIDIDASKEVTKG
jgi:hypothetical protein